MSLFGKSLAEYARFTRIGMILILMMGLARFIVGVSGVPYETATHLLSLTILSPLLALIYGQRAAASGFGGYRHLLPTTVLLSVTMYGFIVLAILVEGLGGIHGYFHAPGMGLQPTGMSVAFHIGGQLTAMLVTTVSLWGFASLGFLISRYLGFLRHAFLLLLGMAVLRVLLGAAGVPYSIGTWITSITLLAMVLAVYYGYRAPSKGFNAYLNMLLVGALLAAAMNLLVIYGIAVMEALKVPNYFHREGTSIGQHIQGHLLGSVVGMFILGLLAGIGFALGKRRAGAPAGQAA